jgi:hypothetical protein
MLLGPLTHHAVTALTRARLAEIESQLLAKIRSQEAVSPLERQVYFLASAARQGLSLAPQLPSEVAPFAQGLSLHAVFGSIGPNIPGYVPVSAAAQRWLLDTLQSGNPEPNRQRVLARSTDFMLAIAERGTALINSSDVSDKPAELRKLKAYVLGHACHVATQVVSAPFVRSLTWRLGDGSVAQLSEAQVAAAFDRVAGRLLNTPSANPSWWPAESDLPARFFDAYRAAIDATYGPGARPELRAGQPAGLSPQVSAAFLRQFDNEAPSSLSSSLLRDGYAAFRTARAFSFLEWLGATAVVFLPPIAAYPLCLAMPHTRGLFRTGALVDGAPVDTERGWFGLVMAPVATSLVAQLSISVVLAAFTDYGVRLETVLGWVAGAAHLVTSLVFFGYMNESLDGGVRWVVLFVLPLVLLLAHSIFVFARSLGTDDRQRLLALASLIPVIITGVYILFHLAWHQSQSLGMNGFLELDEDGNEKGWESAGFIGGWVLWGGLLLGSWVLFAHLMERSVGADARGDQLASQKHLLRLFSRSTLFFDPALTGSPDTEAANPPLGALLFPSDRRPLLKLWWEGGGELWLRSERNVLTFSTSSDGTGDPQTVLAAAAPMTARQFARFLNQAVKEGSAFSNQLKAELVDPNDFDYVLPPGPTFSDGGDDKSTVTEHAAARAAFVQLGTSSSSATILYHAPRGAFAGFHGSAGPQLVDGSTPDESAGFDFAPASVDATRAGSSILELAAELGTILCMGTASRLLTTTERRAVTTGANDAQHPAVNPVQQVFRNWNLSQRRVNEWQMLVGGRAISEKRGRPADADSLQPNAPQGWSAPTPSGERVANQLGWLPLLQRWLDVAKQPGVDSLATDSPSPDQPSPFALSEGLAFLLDLPMPSVP